MPNRIIREAILSSERVASLGWPAEVFYRRLMSIVDDYGRHEAHPQLLRSRCYPLQTDNVRTADITRWMAECQKAGLILGYEVEGKRYLEILNFGQQRRSASKCPPPSADADKRKHPPADAPVFGGVSVDEDEGGDEGDARVTARPTKRCPPSFEPDEELRQWAMRDFPAVDFRAELAKFRDHEFAKARSDWPAALRNWIRKADELRPRKGGRESTAEHNDRAFDEWMAGTDDGRTIDA